MNYTKLTDECMKDMFLKKPLLKKANAMSKGELGTLLYLSRVNNEAFAGEISKSLQLTSGRMASILKALEKKGFISKKKGLNDCRRTIVSISKTGEDFLKVDREIVFRNIRNMLAFLGEEDAKAYVRVSKRLNKEFDKEKMYYDENKETEE